MISRLLLALLLPALPLLAAGEALAQAKLYAGPQTDPLYEETAPRLMTALFPEHRLGLRSSSGGVQTLRLVLDDPEALGFVQADLLRDHVSDHPGDAERLLLFGDLGLRCLYAAVREGGWVADFEDLLRQREDQPIRVDVGPPEGDAAASFAAMRRIEPELAGVELEHRGGLRALHMVEAGLTDVAFFVEQPSLDSPALAKILEGEGLALMPVVSRGLLATDGEGEGSYLYTRVVVQRNPWLRRETSYETLCTPLGVVANAAGDPNLLDAVAFATISGELEPRDPGLVENLLTQAEGLRDTVMRLLQRF